MDDSQHEDGNVIGFTIDEYFKNIKIDFIKEASGMMVGSMPAL